MLPFEQQLEKWRRALEYNPNTGVFYWKIHGRKLGGTFKPGDIAGTTGDSYVRLAHEDLKSSGHVLAYWFIVGEPVPPGFEIDHRDRRPSNNAWCNLRLATRSLNNHNREPESRNTSGVRGVSWVKEHNCWDARIHVDRVTHTLGYFEKFTDAVRARIAAEERFFNEVFSKHALAMTEPLYQPPLTPKGPDLRELPESRLKVATRKRNTNTSGHVGVAQHPKTGRWIAQAGSRWVGSYATLGEAVEARARRLKELYEGEQVLSAKELAAQPRTDGRTTTQGAKQQATRLRPGNNTGYSGIMRVSSGRFTVRFKNINRGTYDTLEEAVAAREAAMAEHYAEE